MLKAYWKYWLGFSVLLAVLVWYELNKPVPLDWRESYARNEKIPYGNKILFEMLPSLFGNQPVRSVRTTVYEDLKSQQNIASDVPENYLIVASELDFTEGEVALLKEYAQNGGHIFLATSQLQGDLAEYLKLRLDYDNPLMRDSLSLNFTEDARKQATPYIFRKGVVDFHIAKHEHPQTTVLGRNSANQTTLVRIGEGKGAFIVSSTPKVFTNYNMLYRNNAEYVAKALSYMPVAPVCWQEFYHLGRVGNDSPLRVVLHYPALRWALFTFLLAGLVFILFKAKRTQRIIPLMKPYENATLSFVKILANLYYNQREHQSIIHKRIAFFEEGLRLRYHFSTEQIHAPNFAEQLANKSLLPVSEVKSMLDFVQKMRERKSLNDDELLSFSTKLDQFWAKAA